MPSKDEFIKSPPNLKIQVNSHFGVGKSFFACSFPKFFYIGTEPGGIDFLKLAENKNLLDNMVEYEYCLMEEGVDIKQLVEESQNSKLYQLTKKARQMALEGKVETLILDNVTYLAELFWIYINKYKQGFSDKTGKLDTRGMYGELNRWLFRFVLIELLPFKGNVVMTCHLREENEEKLAKKKDSSVEITPQILGGFRDKSEGMFTASLYLDRKTTKQNVNGKLVQTTKFVAYCQKTDAWGSTILAKNRIGLPLEVENVSYQKLIEAMGAK